MRERQARLKSESIPAQAHQDGRRQEAFGTPTGIPPGTQDDAGFVPQQPEFSLSSPETLQ